MKIPEKVHIDDFGSGFSHGWHTEHSYEKDIIKTQKLIKRIEDYETFIFLDICHRHNLCGVMLYTNVFYV